MIQKEQSYNTIIVPFETNIEYVRTIFLYQTIYLQYITILYKWF